MFGSRRLEQNAIKVIPAGAFSPYKKLRRMWVDDEIHALRTAYRNAVFQPRLWLFVSTSLFNFSCFSLALSPSLSPVSFFFFLFCSSQRFEQQPNIRVSLGRLPRSALPQLSVSTCDMFVFQTQYIHKNTTNQPFLSLMRNIKRLTVPKSL